MATGRTSAGRRGRRRSCSDCVHAAAGGAVALGVDLPIGLPRAYAAALPERDFLHFLAATATRPDFFQVCATLAEVGPGRPFYPARGDAGDDAGGACRGARVSTARPRCRAPATAPRRSGRRALRCSGRWERTSPARRRSRRGRRCCCRRSRAARNPALAVRRRRIAALLAPGAVALAETYPAEALRHLGMRLKGSKRRQADRAAVASQLAGAMAALGVLPDPELQQAAADGFGGDAAGEDRFDCVLGVLCVLNVLGGQPAGHRAARSVDPPLGGLGAGPDRAAGQKEMARPAGRARGCFR